MTTWAPCSASRRSAAVTSEAPGAPPRCARIASARLFPSSGTVDILSERLGRVDVSELHPRIGLLSSALAANVRPGAAMRVTGPSGEFDAVVTGVAADAGLNESGATVIRARPSSGTLPPAGSAVSGSVVTGQATSGGMTVPSEAVQTVDGNTVVFVQVQGGFQAVQVLAGRQAAGRTEILRGPGSTFAGRGCNPFFFTTSYNNDQVHSVMGQAATDGKYGRVFVLTPNYQAGRDAAAGFKSRFKGEVVDEVYVPLTQLDFSAELAKIAAAKPDAVFTFMPTAGVRLQEAASTRSPSISTMQARQLPSGR